MTGLRSQATRTEVEPAPAGSVTGATAWHEPDQA
jgi:hypothetical protein